MSKQYFEQAKLQIIFFVLVFFGTVNSVVAQEKSDIWTLESCIEYALENNIQIKQTELNTKYSELSLQQAKANRLPTVNAGAEYQYTFGRSIDQYTNQFIESNVQSSNLYLNASLLLFGGFKTERTIKQNEYSLLANLQDIEWIKNNISLSISTAFLQILFNEELLEIAESQLEITNLQIDRTQKLVAAGTLTEGDLLENQAQAANEILQVINAKNNLDASYLTLKQLLEIQTDTFEIVRPEIGDISKVLITESVDQIYSQATELPQIKSAEYNLKKSETSIMLSKSGYNPELRLNATYYTGYSDARQKYSIGDVSQVPIGFVGSTSDIVFSEMASYNTENYPFFDQLADNASIYVSLSLRIPIFNNMSVRTQVSSAKIERLNAQYNLELAHNNLYKDIQKAYADAQAAQTKYVGSMKALEAGEEAFRYTEQKFNVGILSSVDYNVAKNNLMKTRSDLLQAKFQFLFTKSILDFYKGEIIEIK